MRTVLIDADRLWSRLQAMSRIGATSGGGVNRQALSPEDTEARCLLLSWASVRGYATSIDPIGNLFIRREGKDAAVAPVGVGSHLDTQPQGGNYDGIYGVLAGMEVLESLDDHGIETTKPVELTVWTNEEGSRFAPTTMGSSVFSGKLTLKDALDATDMEGVSVASALQDSLATLGDINQRPLGTALSAFLELHIEQGPVLEQAHKRIGVVTGVQGLRWFGIEVFGEAGHAGTTPQSSRKDALMSAVRIIEQLGREAMKASPDLRLTIGRFLVQPGSPNTIPDHVEFTIDLRHPDEKMLHDFTQKIKATCEQQADSCRVHIDQRDASAPTGFDQGISATIREVADYHNYSHMSLMSGATHDAKLLAALCPTAMIFIPCKDGVSHNENESIDFAQSSDGTQILADVISTLAG